MVSEFFGHLLFLGIVNGTTEPMKELIFEVPN